MSQQSQAGMSGMTEYLLNGHSIVKTNQCSGHLRTNKVHVLGEAM